LISGFQPDEWGDDHIRRAMPGAIGNSQGDARRYWKQGFQPLYIDGCHGDGGIDISTNLSGFQNLFIFVVC
jgi:hypothetical protein